jgi:ribonuclease R
MTDNERLLAAVDASRGRPQRARELGAAAGFHGGDATRVKRLLRDLVRAGALVREGRTYRRPGTPGPAPAKAAPRRAPRRTGDVTGLLTRRPEGSGFVTRLSGPEGEDVYLPPHELRGALDGDRLRIRLVPGRFGRDAGELLEIVERRRTHLVWWAPTTRGAVSRS